MNPQAHPPHWPLLLSVMVAALLAAGGLWILLGSLGQLSEDPGLRLQESFGSYSRQPIDDSGFEPASNFVSPIDDPRSLEQVRDAYHRIGYLGLAVIEENLRRGDVPPQQEAEQTLVMATLCLYEGDGDRAAAILTNLRARIVAHPERLRPGLPTVVFLQGMTGLRQAETDNCVQNCCQGSCIFPIQPQAVHKKRQGAQAAVRHFTEYLRQRPGDIGVRWLLNIAYMVLGEYPDGVPPEYRISLDPFRSDFDIGRFVDRAKDVGLDRLNQAGGAIMDDFDNDGWLDIVVSSMDPGQAMALYRNKGDGSFEERTKAAGLERQLGGLYCVQTDYNNDGWLDIYVCRGAWRVIPIRHSLLRNNKDGTFTDVTREAGLDFPIDGQVATWADYDNDGRLDLFVGGETTRSRLYHNKGDGTFAEVALKAGVGCDGVFCKGAAWGDYDGDGLPDLYVSNLKGPDRLFHNKGDGTFTDVAEPLGLAQPHYGFACWFFDYDNDGWPDLFTVSYERLPDEVIRCQLGMPHKGKTCRLFHNLGGKRFQDVSSEAGLSLALCPMGCNFADFDNDGFPDIYLGTGTPAYSMLVPNRMFQNVRGQRFADVTLSSGTGHLQKGHGVACGDWRRTGSVDLFVELGGATPGDRFFNALFENPGQGNHSLTVKLVGRKTNRAAVGARIKAVVPGPEPNIFYRHVTSGSSFGANPLQQTVGVGKATRIERLEVYWPTSGTTQVFRDVAADQAIEITELATDYRTLYRTVPKIPPLGGAPRPRSLAAE